MKFRARVDANQKEIIKALRDAGASVQPLHSIGQGCPDLLVGFRGVTYLLEVKNPKTRKVGGLSIAGTKDRQKAWHKSWRGVPPVKVYTEAEALVAVGIDPRLLPLDDQLRTLLNAGEKIRAIKLCREVAHIGLREAKDYVEAL